MVAFFTSDLVIRISCNQLWRHVRALLHTVSLPDRHRLLAHESHNLLHRGDIDSLLLRNSAAGGPVGVGQASGRRFVRNLVTIMVLDITTTVMLWGWTPKFEFKG